MARQLGVGRKIKRWLLAAGIRAERGCGCNDVARKMDKAGPDIIRKHIDDYTNAMVESAAKWRHTTNKSWVRPPRMILKRIILKACDEVEAELLTRQTEFDAFTVCITHYRRPGDLVRLRKSIPVGCKVLEQDTDGNLSWARNRMLEQVTTPYAMIIEEDMRWRFDTNVWHLSDVLAHDRDVAFVGGRVLDNRNSWHHDMKLMDGKLVCVPASDPWKATPNQTVYQTCDLLPNWGLVRTDVAREIPWDEDLELCEHRDWFIRLIEAGHKAAFTPQSCIDHLVSRPSKAYNDERKRAHSFFLEAEKKHGIKFTQPERKPSPLNLVVMAVTNSNTRVVVRMLERLGWQVGKIDQYAEHPEVHRLNQRAERRSRLEEGPAERLLEGLREPWVLKDPKFRNTLHMWLPLLTRHQPTLLYVTKDPKEIAASWVRRGHDPAGVPEAVRACEKQFAEYPWAKVQIDAGQLEKAVSLYRLNMPDWFRWLKNLFVSPRPRPPNYPDYYYG